MTLKDQDQLVEDLKREYPAASQGPAAMKKAREVADEVLAEWLAGLLPQTRGVIVSRLFDDFAKAGFAILPRELDFGMIEAAMKCSGTDIESEYRAMVQHYESNSGGGE